MKIESKMILSCGEYEAVKIDLIDLSNQIDNLREKLPAEISTRRNSRVPSNRIQ